MTIIHSEIKTVGKGLHLLAFSLIAGSLLVADSLAIHSSPLKTSSYYVGDARCGRRRSPFVRPGTDNFIHSSKPSVLLASSQSDTPDNDITETQSDDHDASVQKPSASTINGARTVPMSEEEYVSIWPKMDELDKRMMKIALPCIANFAINPLIGAVDLFWVNRMGNALAVAGQSAANQVFSSAFWIVSVLPSGTFLSTPVGYICFY